MINIFNPLKHLNKTDKLILNSVNKFCRNILPDYINKHEYRALYKEMGNLGILGCNLSNDNCLGLSNTMYGLISKEIEYVDSGFRSLMGVQSSLVMKTIDSYANEEIKNNYIPDLQMGNIIGCFGLTEADSGSNVAEMKTTAIKIKNDYILNGSKTWITNAPIADLFVIWAKCDDKVNGFIIERGEEGLETATIENKLSMNNTSTGMIFLDNCKIPSKNRLDVVGLKGPLNSLNSARIGVSIGSLGAAEACIDIALDYCKNRTLFGNLLCEKQLVQSKLVDMITKYNLGLALALKITENIDENDFVPEMISMMKMANPQLSLEIARSARDILGGNGITEEYKVFRHLANLETVNTYEGTHDIHKLILGNYFTGKSAF